MYRAAQLGLVWGALLQPREAGENAQLPYRDTTVLLLETPLLQYHKLCTQIIDNFDGLKRRAMPLANVLLQVSGHKLEKNITESWSA